MWLQFIAQNLQFAISLFACLTFLAVGWLYFDAWKNLRKSKELFRWIGFLLIGVSYLLQSSIIESTLSDPLFSISTFSTVNYIRIVGYVAVIASLLKDPLMKVPDSEGIKKEMFSNNKRHSTKKRKHSHAIFSFGAIPYFVVPALSLGVAGLYWLRATKGLEKHLKPIALSFSFIFVSDLFAIASQARDTTNPSLFDYVQPFGYFWFAGYAFLSVGVIILGKWVWSYLIKRFFSQFVMLFMLFSVLIFIATSLSFSALLLRNVRSATIDSLENTTNVLQFAIETKVRQSSASAKLLAKDSGLVQALSSGNRESILSVTKGYLRDNQLTDFYVVDASGQVLVRGQDADQWGDSLSSDQFVRRSLIGSELSGAVVDEGVLAPMLLVRGSAPVRDTNNTIIGVVAVSLQLDSAFLEGVQRSEGLEVSLFAETTMSATTIRNGAAHSVGLQIADSEIEETVLLRDELHVGSARVDQVRYNTVSSPIPDVDNVPVGILMVADKESNLLRLANRSIEISFMSQSALVIVLILPVAYISKKLENQI